MVEREIGPVEPLPDLMVEHLKVLLVEHLKVMAALSVEPAYASYFAIFRMRKQARPLFTHPPQSPEAEVFQGFPHHTSG